MSDFAAATNLMRAALKRAGAAQNGHGETQPQAVATPPAPTASREEMSAHFVRELKELGGKAVVVDSPQAAIDAIVEFARVFEVKSAAIGEGARTDLQPLSEALGRNGVAVFSVAQAPEEKRAELRARVASADAGVVEADFGVAASGTLVFVPTPARPRSLSLVPPVNIVLLRTDYLLPNLAALMSALGVDAMRDNPVAFVTGPSRTADIEKRLVRGVHGPKTLYAVLVRSGRD
jgi:L-lactate dehydrogenase complex protein LldG